MSDPCKNTIILKNVQYNVKTLVSPQCYVVIIIEKLCGKEK